MTDNSRDTLIQLLHLSARYLDDSNHTSFLELFTKDGEYLISSYAPELADKMIWMRRSRDELEDRLAAVNEHEWEIAGIEQTRVLSVDVVSVTDNSARSSSSFSLFHTDAEGRSELYAVGRYEDEWAATKSVWLLSRREVQLKTRLLKLLSPLPV
ncbi:MAG: hypothetical protein GKR93_13325 [Gammaproteobacteria bacterium]|nr:hypothetical protein [Gammaproteobacteria bacterium]